MHISPVNVNYHPSYQNISYKSKTVQSSVETQKEDKKTSKGAKIGIAVGVGAALVAIGAVLVSRGKALQNKKLLSQIPADLRTRFEKLKGLSGEEFTQKAYAEMVEHMGLKGIAPEKIVIMGADSLNGVQGGYSCLKNTIEYTEGFSKMSQKAQIGLLSHELHHCRQFSNMLRTEGITVEKYVDATAENLIKNMQNDISNVSFRMSYKRAQEAGKLDEFLAKVKKQAVDTFTEDVNKNYSHVLKMPKIKADSPEGKKAFEYLKAMREYEGLDSIFGFASEAYKNNLLEVEAYGFQHKIEDLFEKFMQATK